MPQQTRHAIVDAVAATHARPTDADQRSTTLFVSRDFEGFVAELRRDLAPASLIESVLAERAILAAWRLHLISSKEVGSSRSKLPPITRDVLRAESSLETALSMLHAARRDPSPRWGQAALVDSKALDAGFPDDADDYPDFSNEWPTLAGSGVEEFNHSGSDSRDDDPDAHLLWRDRLVFDDKVSDRSPVVKGTWVTAGHVVSLIVDGWTWSDVLRAHPELNEDDVRACLAYTVAQDSRDDC